MKTLRYLTLVLPVISFFYCYYPVTIKATSKMADTNQPGFSPIPDTLIFDKYVAIYEFDSTYRDSSLFCEQWFLNDSLIKQTHDFYYKLLIKSEFVDEEIIASANGKASYETYFPLLCETGGHSAWNKYIFKYGKNKRPQTVDHYKAFRESYDKQGN